MDLEHLEAKPVKLPSSVHATLVHYPRSIYIVARRKLIRDGWPNFSVLARALLEGWVRGEIKMRPPESATKHRRWKR